MATLNSSTLNSSTLHYIPVRAAMLPYLQGAIEALEADSLWDDDASYEAAYNAIAEMRIAMAALGNTTANMVLAGPSSGAAAPAAYRKLLAVDLPAIAYASLTGIPATFAPAAHASSHGSAGSDKITPAAIGAAATTHAHDYTALANIPTSFNPIGHAFRHLTGGLDPITPAGIGAATTTHTHITEPWITPNFQNGWSNYGAGYNAAGYYKDPAGIVHLRGLLKNPSPTINTQIFTLSPGYYPAAVELFGVAAYTNAMVYGRVDIDSAGQIIYRQGGGTFLSLDGITFRAA
jgi:hypothetical protein